MKVQEILGRTLNEIPVGPDWTRPLPHTSVGMEVEVEGLHGVIGNLKHWQLSRDGSLQNGVEFISHPVWGTAITGALEELGEYFKENPPYISFRTSIHVHVNCLDMEADALVRLMLLYLMYEPALFRLHQKWNRYYNIFCVPAHESLGIQKSYAEMISMLENQGHIADGYGLSKYSALNINPLRQLGTIEFRHMGGTDNVNEISAWVNVLLQLKAAAIMDEPIDQPEEVWGDLYPMLDIKPADLETGQRIINRLQLWR